MSSGRGIFLSAIVLIGILSIGSVFGISWMLQPEQPIPSSSPLTRGEKQQQEKSAVITPLDKGGQGGFEQQQQQETVKATLPDKEEQGGFVAGVTTQTKSIPVLNVPGKTAYTINLLQDNTLFRVRDNNVDIITINADKLIQTKHGSILDIRGDLKLDGIQLLATAAQLNELTEGAENGDATELHHHDGRYYTETELSNTEQGKEGSRKIGTRIANFTNFSPQRDDVEAALAAIDTAFSSTSPVSSTYLTLSSNTTLTGERVATAGTGITITDAGANSTATLAATLGTSIAASEVDNDVLDFAQVADSLTLDASTDISVTSSNVLSITNTGTGNSFVVNDASSDSTPFVVDASGNVGVGISSPTAKLDITKSENATLTTFTQSVANNAIAINSTVTLPAYTPGMIWYTTDNNPTKPKAGIWTQNTSSGTSMYLGTSNSYSTGITNQAITIDYAGNIGFGTTSPNSNAQIHVYEDSSNSTFPMTNPLTDGLAGGSILLQNSNGSTNTHTAVVFAPVSNLWGAVIDGRVDTTGTALDFYTSSGVSMSHRMIITGAGAVGIADTTPDYLLELSSAASSDSSFALSDADVAHGLTELGETDAYFLARPISSTTGGTKLEAFSDTDAAALQIYGYIGSTDPTDTIAAIKLIGAKKNTTGVQDLAAAETVFQIANNDDTAALTVYGNGSLSVPGAGSGSERFGINATAAGTSAVAIGNAASATGTGAIAIGQGATTSVIGEIAIGQGAVANGGGGAEIAIGYLSSATGNFAVSMGYNVTNSGSHSVAIGRSIALTGESTVVIGGLASGGVNSTVIGYTASNAGHGGVALGSQSAAAGLYSIALGTLATTTAAQQMVIGGGVAYIDDIYIGKGVTNAAPVGVKINAGGGSGTDIAGAALTLAGGKGTGSASGGAIIFQTSDAGSSGSTLQSLTQKFIIAANGTVGIGTDTSPDASLEVINDGSGDSFLVADTNDGDTTPFVIQADGDVGVGTASPTAKLEVAGSGLFTGTYTDSAGITGVQLGAVSGTAPRILLGNGTASQNVIIDNSGGSFLVRNSDGTGLITASGGAHATITLNGSTTTNLDLNQSGGKAFQIRNYSSALIINDVTAGVERLRINTTGNTIASGQLDAGTSGDGVVTEVVAGACDDSAFTTDTNGLICIDSTNGRIYYRYGGAWHYSAQTAGFQIPNLVTEGRNETEGLEVGDYVIGKLNQRLDDGALHGLYVKFDLATEIANVLALHPELLTSLPDKGGQGWVSDPDAITFLKDVRVAGIISTSNSDVAGKFSIPAGKTTAKINFKKAFSVAPVINLTAIGHDEAYKLDEVTKTSFTVSLKAGSDNNASFSWFAIEATGAESTVEYSGSAPEPEESPEPSESEEPTSTPEPSSTPEPTNEPTPTPEPGSID